MAVRTSAFHDRVLRIQQGIVINGWSRGRELPFGTDPNEMKRITLSLSLVVGIVATAWALYEHKRCALYINHFVDYEFDLARNITIVRLNRVGHSGVSDMT